jgi:hypothetical protein
MISPRKKNEMSSLPQKKKTWDEFIEAYVATANRKAMLDFFKIQKSKSS